MNLSKNILKHADGLALLVDWLGKGGDVVPKRLADKRARTCAYCEYNGQPLWWEKSKDTVAQWIRAQLEIKHDMKLKAAREGDLNICQVCGCCLRLKVWVPTSHIVENTSVKTMKEFPEWCWIAREAR